jgi:hypothetical protein
LVQSLDDGFGFLGGLGHGTPSGHDLVVVPSPTQRPDMLSPCGWSTKYIVPFDRIDPSLAAYQPMRTSPTPEPQFAAPVVAALSLAEAAGIWPDDRLVFTTRTGHAIEPRAVNRRFDALCAKAGVRRIRVHDTRRTCGSLLAALNVHPRVAMAILRHSRILITMEIYTEVSDPATEDALRRLSDALGDVPADLPGDGE